MRNKNTIYRQFYLLAAAFLTACTVTTQTAINSGSVDALDRETADLADIRRDVVDVVEQVGKDKVLVVFDIDNTLMAMEQGLGSDQWYDWQKDLNTNDLCNPDNVGNRFAVQGALYFVSAMRNTQKDGPGQVEAIQSLGVPVIALTSRGMEYQLQTFRELRRNGYNFSFSSIGPPGGYGKPFMPVEGGRFSLYQDGIFLTAGQHKGQMLMALLEKTGTPPPGVIVIADDKQKNLDDMKETFTTLNVPVRAWRYTGEDANVENFNTREAANQWQQLENHLKRIQQIVGPDNYNLDTAKRPQECTGAESS